HRWRSPCSAGAARVHSGPLSERILPRGGGWGNGRKPYGNRQCLHALLYVLAAGIAWEMMPLGFPSYKTVQRRLKLWLRHDLFHQAWQQLAQRYERRNGINWDQVLLDGSKKPSQKGVKNQALGR